MQKQIFANIALFITALIWGLSFVAQRAGMDYVGPFTFNAVRSILGGFSLIPVIFLVKLLQKDTRTKEIKHEQHKNIFQAGLFCGIALFTAISIQQYSMQYVQAGKAGFISALYIIYVPLISMFFGKRLDRNVKLSVAIALIGLYLLCCTGLTSGFSFYDFLILVSAFFYGVHILVVSHFSGKINPVKVSCFQFFVAGILTCGVAYTLQIFGQKYTIPTVASIIMCTESVFAVIGGILILNEAITPRQILGCIFMICAVIISEHKSKNKRLKKSRRMTLNQKIKK